MVTAERAFASGAGFGTGTKDETYVPRDPKAPAGRRAFGSSRCGERGLVYCARAVADTGRLGLGLRDNRRDGIFLERVFENLVERAHVGDL